MMKPHPNVESFRKLIEEWLPGKLAELVDLVEYEVQAAGEGRCGVRMRIGDRNGVVTVQYEDIPCPRPDGVVLLNGTERVVIMTADRANLERATIKCVGEQIRDQIEERLVALPDLPEYTPELLQAWLPIDRWITDFVVHSPTSQVIDDLNWLARQTHLRRLRLPDDDAGWHASHIGRVCPLETPEGPNCGKILHLAMGARVSDGKIEIVDDSPVAHLGLGARMLPLIEHNDLPRQLMGCNMMRQWLDLGEREPALVKTGNEPEAGEAWYGRSLLTAFIFWKGMNYEDGIVVSESAAQKLVSPDPLDVGDKLSNRHGTKGTVGAILPDDEMPHLPDGRPVELVFDMIGLQTRLNFGQVREAVLGNIAHARGEPVICPPFEAPSSDEIRAMLREVGLPDSGQVRLSDGRGGELLAQPSTAGYVYWGKTYHRSREKLAWFTEDPLLPPRAQRQGEMENWVLQTCEAYENLIENVSTRSTERETCPTLADALVAGPVEQAEPPSALFGKVRGLLRTAGIEATFDGEQVSFSFATPTEEHVELAMPLAHPWCPEHKMTHIGPPSAKRGAYQRFLEANRRAGRSLNGSTPESLRENTREELEAALRDLLDALDLNDEMRIGSRVWFSSRGVITAGYDLQLGEIGLPETMAWGLFSPLVAREVGAEATRQRGPEARQALERALADNLVIANRAPSLQPTNLTAFRAVLREDPAIRLHPLTCRLFNADFDGDQMAIMLPVTKAAQEEAREKLTLEGHLRLDPGGVLACITPAHNYLHGLAWATRSEGRRERLLAAWPGGLPEPPTELTRQWLVDRLRELLEAKGSEALLGALQRLMELGGALATEWGASLHPFVGEALRLPTRPGHPWPGGWYWYCDAVEAAIVTQADPESPDLGPQIIAIRSGARGNTTQLCQLVGCRGPVGTAPWGGPVVASSLRDGVTPEELFACVGRARGALQGASRQVMEWGLELRRVMRPQGDTVLACGLRARQPGEVLANAALQGESDPLTDPSVRLWMGLRPRARGVGATD